MNDERLQTIEQVRQFLEGGEAVEFRGLTVKEKYCWIEEVLIRFRYHRLKRSEKGVVWAVHREGNRPSVEGWVTGIQSDSGVQTDRAIEEKAIQEAPLSPKVYPARNWAARRDR